MIVQCPICKTKTAKTVVRTPYLECPTCLLWFQDPLPPKVYQAPTEHDLEAMPEADREVNRELGRRLFANVMKGRPGRTLDIGAKHPVLASTLGSLGCEAHAIDAVQPSDEPHVSLRLAIDFEAYPGPALKRQYDLVTMIHVFEHMYDPLAALRKLRALVADSGRVFIRIPDHFVKGYERDLTPHHFSIHPYFHSLTSLLEALAQARDCFEIEQTYPFPGVGQRDVILRPISRAPRLAVAMIAKNEERDIGRAIRSFRPIAATFSLVDTGSTDRTIDEAYEAWADDGTITADLYLDASECDPSGEWKLWSFSQARNEALQDAEAEGMEWVAWFDADDELTTPNAMHRAMYWPEFDAFNLFIDAGGSRWPQTRMWKAARRVRFKGRCHEYPVLDGLKVATIDESIIRHHAEPTPNVENSNPRNLRILLREWEEEPTPRTAFYLANTYKDAGRHLEATIWYARRLEFGVGYRDEYLFSMLYRARCLREIGDHIAADAQSEQAIALAPDWAEFQMDIASGAYQCKDYRRAIEIAEALAARQPAGLLEIPPTSLWREIPMYRDQPPRLISWCYEHLGELESALKWSRIAAGLIGGPDTEWEMRERRLAAMVASKEVPAPAIVKRRRRQVALHRPGAIGDILMTLNLVPAFRDANPDADVHYFCDASLGAPDALGGIMQAAGVDLVLDRNGLQAWRKSYDSVIDLIGYPLAEGYPERPMRRHLLEYFANEMGLGVTMSDGATVYGARFELPAGVRAVLPSLTLRRPKYDAGIGAEYATLQLKAGWSRYKEWPAERWRAVLDALPFPTIIIDAKKNLTLAQSIAVFANARMHLGIDSFTNHLTNYFWETDHGARRVRGVILWGSTQYDASGYDHNINLSRGLHCQPCFRETAEWSQMKRAPCVNMAGDVHRCMAEIFEADVIDAATALWEQT